MRRTATELGANANSILDYDQLQQIVSRNQVFIRDFILVICCILVFVILLVFILFVLSVGGNVERLNTIKTKREKRLLANIDYRYA
ncbi:ac108 [Artaxa digramma nucleopolyhedrovirus]|uniref:Ac108 n=1 Tax=Artaxa digramma nucleopolyhedrovirus TaxID=3070910 RepID=A0AAE6UZT6_9ABAC|nr:ac108 [Euproctis digramma nucleopolyhedrovirus]QHB21757.1 ac108 [Artaxa digramma nucleopolyhedrovirus]